jgi:hypothetical protein
MRLIEWKICASCTEKRSIDDFGKNKSQPLQKHYYCKQCMKERSKKNREEDPQYYKNYRSKNLVKLVQYSKQYKKDNRDKINEYNRNRPSEKKRKFNEKKKQREKEIRQTEAYKNRRKIYCSKKYREDIQFQLKKKFEAKLNYLLDKNDVIESVTLIGCSIPEYKNYLEQRFIGEMSWAANYGTLWCIDRIIPFIEWDLTNPAEAALCFHYTNSQPLFLNTTVVDGVEYIGNLNKGRN